MILTESRDKPGCFRCDIHTKGLMNPGTLAELAEQIPMEPSLRADAEVYKNRIALCGTCEALRESILCAYCGCFIFFRARPAKSYCPHPKGNKWRDSTT
jgi:hypothetical protein